MSRSASLFFLFIISFLILSCKGNEVKKNIYEYEGVEIPVKKVICMSTTQVACIDCLGADSVIVGVSGSQYISNPKIINGLKNGSIKDVGYEASLNYEMIISLKPDVVFAYSIQGGNNSYIEKMQQLGIKVIIINEYLDATPLGKLDYLKTFAQLLKCPDKADSVISYVSAQYNDLKTLASNEPKVKVLMNAPWKDVWYIPGGKNNISILVKDAGGEIVGSVGDNVNSFAYGIEKVFVLGQEAEFWLNPGHYNTLNEILIDNPLFGSIPSFKEKKVFNNNLRSTPGGGNDFWETGIIEPHLILEDLIRILHPDLLPEGEFHYYKKLN